MSDVPADLAEALRGRYEMERVIGRGGMAHVYLARDVRHDRQVAIKVLRRDAAAIVGADRFLEEIRVTANLQHPAILTLIDSGQAAGVPYFVMPYVAGDSLRQRLAAVQRLPVAEAVAVAAEVADALEYAHRHGVIHRDIKPENILLAEGHAFVADFGVARALADTAVRPRLTETGLAVGTVAYMSPEQAAGDPALDARSDVYSLGLVLSEMLTGRLPGVSDARYLAKQGVPPGVRRAIAKAVRLDPADRFQSAAAFRSALLAPAPSAAWRSALIATATVAGLAGAAWLATREGDPQNRPWVLIADFDGPADDPSLAAAVRELATVELDQSRSFNTMPRSRVQEALRAAGLADTAHVPADRARELALRSAVRGVVTGVVHPVGPNRYALVLRAVAADDGREIASVAGEASDARLVSEVQDLARRLRATLGEHRRELASTRSLEQISTPSFPAYRKLLASFDRMDSGDLAGSNRLLREAIALDTGFATAWAMLGMNYLTGRQLDSARHAFGEALRRPERLSDARRYRLQADAAYAIDHDLEGAVRWYDLYLREVPGSVGGHNNRGLYLSSLGRHEEALAEFTAGVNAVPFGPETAQIEHLNQAAELVVLGRLAEAQGATRTLRGPFAAYAGILLAVARSQWDEAGRQARAVLSQGDAPGFLRIQAVTALAGALVTAGDPTGADSVLAAAEGTSASPDERRWYRRARLLLAQAHGRAVPAFTIDVDSTVAGVFVAGLRAAQAGDTVQARARLADLHARGDREHARIGQGAALVEGMLAFREGNARRTVDLLAGPARAGEHDATYLDRAGSHEMRWLVASAYERLGLRDSAIAFYEMALRRTALPPGHLPLGGIIENEGKRRIAVLRAGGGATP
jgi:serine/threonine-protein kinase